MKTCIKALLISLILLSITQLCFGVQRLTEGAPAQIAKLRKMIADHGDALRAQIPENEDICLACFDKLAGDQTNGLQTSLGGSFITIGDGHEGSGTLRFRSGRENKLEFIHMPDGGGRTTYHVNINLTE